MDNDHIEQLIAESQELREQSRKARKELQESVLELRECVEQSKKSRMGSEYRRREDEGASGQSNTL
jgi:predicted RNA-binding Zn ribbon-like protein